jgi:hypothetical protein
VPGIPLVTAVPITQSNPIWLASQVPLARWGYTDEEFFIEGNANIYSNLTKAVTDSAALQVSSTIPYKTRILVRRPVNPRRYSGNIILEPIHPSKSTPALATDFRWVYGSGDIWVGVEPPGNNGVLKQFNKPRYESLTDNANLTVHDLLSQTAALLQSSSSPIKDFKPKYVFMQGVSATCQIVSQYIIAFHRNTRLADGKPIVNGYFPSECSVLLPDIDVPVMRVNTQYDFKADTRKADSDKPDGRFRLYELAGAAHFSTNNILFGEAPTVINGMGITGATASAVTCKEFGPPKFAAVNDFPVWVIYDAALRNLEAWVQKGKAPPHAERFVTDADGKAVLDEYGNFKGGLRTSVVDAPAAAWFPIGTGCSLWGYKVPFAKDVLDKLYPTHESYVRKVRAQAEKMFSDGLLTRDDADYLIMSAEKSSIPQAQDASLLPMQAFYPMGAP